MGQQQFELQLEEVFNSRASAEGDDTPGGNTDEFGGDEAFYGVTLVHCFAVLKL